MRNWLDDARGLLAGLLPLGAGLLAASAVDAAEPLVEKAWLEARLGDPHVVVLDLRPADAYSAGHIPGAVSAAYGTTEWTVPGPNGAARALPPVPRVAATIGALGVGDADTVVIVADSFPGAARAYWTFKVLGHNEVSILDGGAQAWNGALDAVTATRPAAVFTPHYMPALRAELPEVSRAASDGSAVLVDARPLPQWNGTFKLPFVRGAGHIPGAVPVDQAQALMPDGRLKPRAALAGMFAPVGDKPAIAYCNSGLLGATDWFVMSEILHRPGSKLYDGSMSEWTADPNRPVVR
jgi:thiosulfate/3-mercaptopyruvate sulfurtransferase